MEVDCMPTAHINLALRIPPEIYALLQRRKAATGESLNQIAVKALEQYLKPAKNPQKS
jgi:predicted HicB family RNase H-like nuclease